MVSLRLRTPTKFWLPKAGNRADEYEDAFRVVYPQRMGAPPRGAARIAVADGASESAFAREWANALADAFASAPPEPDDLDDDALATWLAPARDAWHDAVPWDRIPWHGEAKARAGAFATLVGLTLSAAPDGSGGIAWQAVAVGDSCLFVVREGELVVSFPLDDASEFDNNPALLCSNPANSGGAHDALRRDRGRCEAGDVLMLATDALAAWFLARHAAGERPWDTLAALDASSWADWVDEQRGAGLMRNDDVTLVAIEVA